MKGMKALLLFCAFSGLSACSGQPARPPNVLIITIDTLRTDALGIYGNPGGHSPNIDAFAADAIVFDHAVTAIGTTVPSHSTLFTGLYPRRHGVRWNGDALDERFTTLAEILSAAGYETAAFVSWGSMLSRGGLHQGISVASDPLPQGSGYVRSGEEVGEMAIPWLAARDDRPFFLWLHYYETHAPYRLTPFAQKELAGYRGPLEAGVPVKTFYSLGRQIPWTPEEIRALRVLYDGEVREADRMVGEVLDTLRREGLISQTVVVITSDHGQALGENGQVGHGFLLSQPVLHVPLVVRVPGIAGRRIPTRVGLVDLMPFLLELLDLPVPPDLDGRSLVPVLAGGSPPPHRYFAEIREIGNRLTSMRRNLREPERLAAALSAALEQDPGAVAVFEREVKGVWKDDEFQVYDLAKDPQELHPQTPETGDLWLAALREAALSYHQGREIELSRRSFNEAVRKELEALGYVR